MIKKAGNHLKQLLLQIEQDNIGLYAAQSAYFLVLSFIPIVMLLVTLVNFTSLTEANILNAISVIFPETILPFVESIIHEVFDKSVTTISISALFTAWSAGKAIRALQAGLNAVNGIRETRNYFLVRIYAAFYTLIFLVIIVLTLIVWVFGNRIGTIVIHHFPFTQDLVSGFMELRIVFTVLILTVFFLFVFKLLPNKRQKLKFGLPGALFTSVSWMVFSYGFSIYFDHSNSFANMYGSLTMIVLVMLWVYFCMFLVLIGSELNKHILKFRIQKEPEKKETNA